MALSGALHGAGALSGALPDEAATVALAVAGAVVGVRFHGITLPQLRRLGLAGLCVTLSSTAVAAAAALAASWLLGVPFGQAWVTYAPGGVEAMAAMAYALGYDPAFVAAHHVLRLVLLMTLLPLLLRRLAPARP
jgi:membrane AbrB-like protein